MHLRPRVGGAFPVTRGGVVRPIVLSPAVVPGELLWWLARLLAPRRRTVVVAPIPRASHRLGGMPRASSTVVVLRRGVPAPPSRGVVSLRPMGGPRGGPSGGPAPLAALVPGPVPITSPDQAFGSCHKVPTTHPLEHSIALFHVVGPQQPAGIRLFVGLGLLVGELFVGVTPGPLQGGGSLGPHAHECPTSILRVA